MGSSLRSRLDARDASSGLGRGGVRWTLCAGRVWRGARDVLCGSVFGAIVRGGRRQRYVRASMHILARMHSTRHKVNRTCIHHTA